MKKTGSLAAVAIAILPMMPAIAAAATDTTADLGAAANNDSSIDAGVVLG